MKVRIQDQDMFIPFQVLPTNGCGWQILLGRTWMQQTNLQIDWIKRKFQLQVSNSILYGKLAERLDPPSTSVEEKPLTPLAPSHKEQVKVKVATTWISYETNQGHGWKVPTTLLKAQGYGKKWKDCWVPKSSYIRHPSSRSSNKKPKPSHPFKA